MPLFVSFICAPLVTAACCRPPDQKTSFITLKNDEVINYQVEIDDIMYNYEIIANHDIWKQLLSERL